MFRDQITGEMSEKGEKCQRLMIAKRDKEYHGWVYDAEEDDYTWEKTGVGFEPRIEINTTEAGLKLWESWTEEQQATFVKSFEKPVVKQEATRRLIR